MEVSGYTMDLYCDHEKHGDLPYVLQRYGGQFTGETNASCKRDAKALGWIFRCEGERICPFCSGKRTVEWGLRKIYGSEADLSDLINTAVDKKK